MHILCIGVNYRTASVSLRENLSLGEETLPAALARYGRDREGSGEIISELTILSTCNRIELYSLSVSRDHEGLTILLEEVSGVSRKAFERHLYQLEGQEVARHIFRVAAGLDSQVLGEPQILGQVAEAHMTALRSGSTGPVLSRLFQTAVHAGKRVRNESAISSGPSTVSSIAVKLASDVVGGLAQAKVVVIGAGEIAELVVEALRKRAAQQITVINRTVSRGQDLAQRWGAVARPLEAILDELRDADIVISSTSAPHTILHRRSLEKLMRQREDRQLVVLDIAVPRDVDEEVGELPGVHLYNLDDLARQAGQFFEDRMREVPRAEAVIEEELESFSSWLETLSVTPLIRELHQQAERIRRQEINRTLRRMPAFDEAERQRIEALTRALVKKLLHFPTLYLKEQSRYGEEVSGALLTRKLFGLDDRSPDDKNHQYMGGPDGTN
jgi:glutamyl-tRNA reductase